MSKAKIVQEVSNGIKKITITSTGPNGASVRSSKSLKMSGMNGMNGSPDTGAGGGVSLGGDGAVVVKIGRREGREGKERSEGRQGRGRKERRRRECVKGMKNREQGV